MFEYYKIWLPIEACGLLLSTLKDIIHGIKDEITSIYCQPMCIYFTVNDKDTYVIVDIHSDKNISIVPLESLKVVKSFKKHILLEHGLFVHNDEKQTPLHESEFKTCAIHNGTLDFIEKGMLVLVSGIASTDRESIYRAKTDTAIYRYVYPKFLYPVLTTDLSDTTCRTAHVDNEIELVVRIASKNEDCISFPCPIGYIMSEGIMLLHLPIIGDGVYLRCLYSISIEGNVDIDIGDMFDPLPSAISRYTKRIRVYSLMSLMKHSPFLRHKTKEDIALTMYTGHARKDFRRELGKRIKDV